MTPVLEKLKTSFEEENLKLFLEMSGSQVACRKISELGRECDIIICADKNLFSSLLREQVQFRLDFACDEIVLAFGSLAKFADEAEKSPFRVIIEKDVRLARADENLAPIGYMTLFTCILKEESDPKGASGLTDALKKKSVYVTDDVMSIVPYLKSGQVDYAFVFKSTCIANDIRYVTLPPEVNLGDYKRDYSSAKIYDIPKKGSVSVASPVVFSLSIPNSCKNFPASANFAKILSSSEEVSDKGFRPLSPAVFHGEKSIYDKYFAKFAKYAGEDF